MPKAMTCRIRCQTTRKKLGRGGSGLIRGSRSGGVVRSASVTINGLGASAGCDFRTAPVRETTQTLSTRLHNRLTHLVQSADLPSRLHLHLPLTVTPRTIEAGIYRSTNAQRVIAIGVL